MKKQLLSFVVTMGLSFSSFAQTTIPNGDFENWQNVGQQTARPTNWNSNKSSGGTPALGPQTCFRDSTTAHSGSYCVKVVTGTVFGTTVNGSCLTGIVEAPTFNAADGYLADTGNVRNAFTGRPDSIVFWYKYTQVGSDYPNVQVRLHVGNTYTPEAGTAYHGDSSANIIGRALWQGTAANQATWARISVPMVYVDGRTPQYIFITTTSSGNIAAPGVGSTLWLDGMEAIYNNSAVESDIKNEPIKIWWNSDKLMAELSNETLTGAVLQVMNMEGQLMLDVPLKANILNAVDANLPAGVYLYQISSDQRNVIGRVVKQ